MAKWGEKMGRNQATSNLCGACAHAQIPSFFEFLLRHSEDQTDGEKFLNQSMSPVEASALRPIHPKYSLRFSKKFY